MIPKLNVTLRELDSIYDKGKRYIYENDAKKEMKDCFDNGRILGERKGSLESVKYIKALREIDTHIRSDKNPIPYIIETLKDVLPEYKEE